MAWSNSGVYSDVTVKYFSNPFVILKRRYCSLFQFKFGSHWKIKFMPKCSNLLIVQTFTNWSLLGDYWKVIVLTLLSNPQLNQDDWKRVLQFFPINSPIEPGIPGIQWFFSLHSQFSLLRILCVIPIQ
jgi:hypothetical protein